MVTVLDASGHRVCDAKVIARTDVFVDRLPTWPNPAGCTYNGPTERSGTYTVTATKGGATGRVEKITVPTGPGGCHVVTQRVTVTLKG